MSSVRKTVMAPGLSSSVTKKNLSLSPPAAADPSFQLRDKGLLRYRPHPQRKDRLAGRPDKTPRARPCFTRSTSSALPRLFPLGSLLCKLCRTNERSPYNCLRCSFHRSFIVATTHNWATEDHRGMKKKKKTDERELIAT